MVCNAIGPSVIRRVRSVPRLPEGRPGKDHGVVITIRGVLGAEAGRSREAAGEFAQSFGEVDGGSILQIGTHDLDTYR